jgi:hypothetical protein
MHSAGWWGTPRIREIDLVPREITSMCFFISLIPATFWVILGYFVLFSSAEADGRIRIFGQILATWIFVNAAGIITVAAYITVAGLCPIEDMLSAVRRHL